MTQRDQPTNEEWDDAIFRFETFVGASRTPFRVRRVPHSRFEDSRGRVDCALLYVASVSKATAIEEGLSAYALRRYPRRFRSDSLKEGCREPAVSYVVYVERCAEARDRRLPLTRAAKAAVPGPAAAR